MNQNKKRIFASFAALSMCLSIPAFATNAQQNTTEEQVYTQTVDLDVNARYAREMTKTVTSTKSLGLALNPGQSATTAPATFRFSLPSNAKVRSVELIPGRGSVNTGGSSMKGNVVFDDVVITSPKRKTVVLTWKSKGMKTTNFANEFANGTWTVQASGRNITPVFGGPSFVSYFGNLIYKNPQMKITYVTE